MTALSRSHADSPDVAARERVLGDQVDCRRLEAATPVDFFERMADQSLDGAFLAAQPQRRQDPADPFREPRWQWGSERKPVRED